jgi:hypothetical protein
VQGGIEDSNVGHNIAFEAIIMFVLISKFERKWYLWQNSDDKLCWLWNVVDDQLILLQGFLENLGCKIREDCMIKWEVHKVNFLPTIMFQECINFVHYPLQFGLDSFFTQNWAAKHFGLGKNLREEGMLYSTQVTSSLLNAC